MKIYMIGICGSSMWGLAKILQKKGFEVCGSDCSPPPLRNGLGIDIFPTHKATNIPKDTTIVVFSSAIGKDNPELLEAKRQNLCVLSRGELLGLISRGFGKVVCVAGSHGKTTTTAMIAKVLAFCGKHATFHFGGEQEVDTCGSGEDIFLCEACEYRNNFLNLSPHIGIICNVEHDHPDFFPRMEDVESAFCEFASKCKILLTTSVVAKKLNLKNALLCDVLECEGQISSPPSFSARNKSSHDGYFSFDFYRQNEFVCEVSLKILGEFNVENALLALACGYVFGATPFELQKGMTSFFGVKRRMEKLGSFLCGELFCDYAHHPKQIECVGKIFPDPSKICVVFQPHTYSRTAEFLSDFVRVLSVFPNLILISTFPAREQFDENGCCENLARNLPHSVFCKGEELKKNILQFFPNCEKYLLLGAGDCLEHFLLEG